MTEIRDATVDDLGAITEIMNALLSTSTVEWIDTPHTVDERRAWFERQLIERARQLDKHVLVAAIDGENETSIRFHERLGFVEVARLAQVGEKLGRWLDLVLLQLLLDDRAQPGGAKNSSAMLSGSRNDRPEP